MAIDELLDEHEQGERVRGWIRRNAAGVIGGIVLGLGVVGGWQYWQKRQDAERALAGARYQAALKSVAGEGAPKSTAQFTALKDTAYGTLASLALAKSQVDGGQRDAAIATLRAAPRADAGMNAVVDQRLARLLVDAGKPEEAIKVLASATGTGALETRGDAELAAGKRDAARASYTKALATAEVGSPQRRLLELKLSDAGGAPGASPSQEAKS